MIGLSYMGEDYQEVYGLKITLNSIIHQFWRPPLKRKVICALVAAH